MAQVHPNDPIPTAQHAGLNPQFGAPSVGVGADLGLQPARAFVCEAAGAIPDIGDVAAIFTNEESVIVRLSELVAAVIHIHAQAGKGARPFTPQCHTAETSPQVIAVTHQVNGGLCTVRIGSK